MDTRALKDGFAGQRMVYVPGNTKQLIKEDQRINDLYITHIGHFPNAKGHHRDRPFGCSQYIFFYCRSGKGWIIINDKKISLEKDQVFIIPPKTQCSYGADKETPWDNYWFHFTGKNANLFSPKCLTPITITQGIYSRIEDRIILFEEILQSLEQYSNFENVVYANISLKYFLSTIKNIDNFRITSSSGSTNIINRAATFMKNNLGNNLKLDDISAACKCSNSNLHKQFIKNVHCSPIEYFIQLKLQKACRQLSDTSKKVKVIAEELGYSDPYYFSRLFTKFMGKSPSQYRKDDQEQ